MTERAIGVKAYAEEERSLQALAVLTYAGILLSRKTERNGSGAGTDSADGEGAMPEQARKRIRRTIWKKQLARHVIGAALVLALLLTVLYAAVWAVTRPYDVTLRYGSGAEPLELRSPLEKAVVIGSAAWLEKNRPTEPIPESENPLRILLGGAGYAVTGTKTDTVLFTVIPHGKSSVQIWRDGRLTEYETVPLRIMRAFDRMRRRIDPVYAEEVPADYYDPRPVRRDSTEGSGAFPPSPYSVFRPGAPSE